MNFKELREQLTDEMLKDILAQFNVEPVDETSDFIIFPTCCHNLEGGSPKLYYYKDSKLFRCYTEGITFDIFTLLQKMYALRGQDISLRQAIDVCGLDGGEVSIDPLSKAFNCSEELRYLQELNNTYVPNVDDESRMRIYDPQVLRQYSFDYMGLMPWIKEGISVETLQKFNIKYDPHKDAIIIPNFNYNGDLIGVRARFFKEEDIKKGKYRPIYWNGTTYSHPTGRTFYGIWENHNNIERKHVAILFEGEKSVHLYGSVYGEDNNIALATLGQNITKDHIKYLLKMKVRNVILAYDTDYEDYNQLAEVEQKYIQKAKLLSPYFNVSILMDYDFILPYKSSPIDGGKEKFEQILKDRRIVK